jgi:hypothetical protein
MFKYFLKNNGKSDMKKQINKKRGPKPKSLIINGDWKEAVKKAVSKPKPIGGWAGETKKKP